MSLIVQSIFFTPRVKTSTPGVVSVQADTLKFEMNNNGQISYHYSVYNPRLGWKQLEY